MTKSYLRAVALGSGLFLLAGCAGSVYSEYFQFLKQSFVGTISGSGISREQAAAIPYASLGYRLNNGQEMLLVLATDRDGEQLWTSSAHIVLLTQDGRVKRTVGLPHDLEALAPVRGQSLPAPASALEGPSTNILAADFPDIGAYSVTIACRLTMKGRESIRVLGQEIATARVDEACESPKLNWRFRNSYWLDSETKLVWRSVQHIHPNGDTLEIEILRPPG